MFASWGAEFIPTLSVYPTCYGMSIPCGSGFINVIMKAGVKFIRGLILIARLDSFQFPSSPLASKHLHNSRWLLSLGAQHLCPTPTMTCSVQAQGQLFTNLLTKPYLSEIPCLIWLNNSDHMFRAQSLGFFSEQVQMCLFASPGDIEIPNPRSFSHNPLSSPEFGT